MPGNHSILHPIHHIFVVHNICFFPSHSELLGRSVEAGFQFSSQISSFFVQDTKFGCNICLGIKWPGLFQFHEPKYVYCCCFYSANCACSDSSPWLLQMGIVGLQIQLYLRHEICCLGVSKRRLSHKLLRRTIIDLSKPLCFPCVHRGAASCHFQRFRDSMRVYFERDSRFLRT